MYAGSSSEVCQSRRKLQSLPAECLAMSANWQSARHQVALTPSVPWHGAGSYRGQHAARSYKLMAVFLITSARYRAAMLTHAISDTPSPGVLRSAECTLHSRMTSLEVYCCS